MVKSASSRLVADLCPEVKSLGTRRSEISRSGRNLIACSRM